MTKKKTQNDTIEDTIKSLEVVNEDLSQKGLMKELVKKIKREIGYKGNIDDAVERNNFFNKYEVVPVQQGEAIVGLKLNYSLKNTPAIKETTPSSGCGPAISYRF